MAYYENFDYLEDTAELALTKRGTLRKRKPKEPKIYFTQDTEDAIIEYLITEDSNKRNLIYNERIKYAFYKLAENIIHSFKFYYTDIDTIEELKYEVIAFLLEQLHKFNQSRSIERKFNKIIIKEFKEHYTLKSFLEYTNDSVVITQQQINDFISTLKVSSKCLESISILTPPKAYSYFGTIAKRYLIIYNKKNYEKLKNQAEVDEIDEDKSFLNDSIREAEDIADIYKFIPQYVDYIDKNLYKVFPKKYEAKIADSIIELFRKRESLEIFNKKALYIYIREMNDVPTPHITKVIKKLDTLRTKLYNEYYEHGIISM